VHVRSYTLRESTNDGGVARFNITFAVAGEARYPTARANTKKGVKNKTAILRSAARASFLDGFTTGGFPGFVSTAAQTVLSAATDVIESAFTVITGDQAAGADYLIRLADIRNNLSALTSAPQDLADELTGLFDAAAAIVSGPSSASRANRQVYDDTSKTAATGATPARQRQAANTNALRGYTRALALAGAADEAVDATYETFNQAAETQAAILEQIDTETHLVDDDDLFLSLEELRGALAAAVPDPDSALPQLVTYTPATTEPSLVAAQRLYGDAARGDEIVARNMIKHPMFLPGSQALQVLADV
jgi:prophage DNA circulation protein